MKFQDLLAQKKAFDLAMRIFHVFILIFLEGHMLFAINHPIG